MIIYNFFTVGIIFDVRLTSLRFHKKSGFVQKTFAQNISYVLGLGLAVPKTFIFYNFLKVKF